MDMVQAGLSYLAAAHAAQLPAAAQAECLRGLERAATGRTITHGDRSPFV
jgi:hypothetical protein